MKKFKTTENKHLLYLLLFYTINFLINWYHYFVNFTMISLIFNVGTLILALVFISKYKNKYILLMFISAIICNMFNVFGYLNYLPSINPIASLIFAIATILLIYKSMNKKGII